MTLLPLLLVLLAVKDPRIELVELQGQSQSQQALELAGNLLSEDPKTARDLGIDYLEGHLLEDLGKPREAIAAYVGVMRSNPPLAPFAVLRVAESQIRLGHPELAAGLLVSFLSGPVPRVLIQPGERLLTQSLELGGDCRVLEQISVQHLPGETRRRLSVAQIVCRLEGGAVEVDTELFALVKEDQTDISARLAVDRLSLRFVQNLDPEASAILGSTHHHFRNFDLAAHYLGAATESLPQQLERREDIETYYRLARSWFWSGRLVEASKAFGELAERARKPEEKARALYQQGRSFELMGDWTRASATYRRAYLADTSGRFASAGLISALRLDWRTGKEAAAQELIDLLPTQRAWRQENGRARLFLASSDIVRRRRDRADAWLSQSEQSLGRGSIEVIYWRGRLAELASDTKTAVAHYLEALGLDPYHPLSLAAQQRLRSLAPLRNQTIEIASNLAQSSRTRELAAAWRALGNSHPAGQAAKDRLIQRLSKSRSNSTFLSLAPLASQDWPIWERELADPEEKLLALGLWTEGNRVVLRHFPVSRPALALTASCELAQEGSTRRALYIAEILHKRIAKDLPDALLPHQLRAVLYPFPFEEEILAATRVHDVDPSLLLAIFREESRFDPEAVSPASARGLGQFIMPTAQRLAAKHAMGPLDEEDLNDPQISIELGGAYLAELESRFKGVTPTMVAAYNAGEAQAMLWRSHCYSSEPEEFFTKVSFGETRAYLERVLKAQSQYREIYTQIGR